MNHSYRIFRGTIVIGMPFRIFRSLVWWLLLSGSGSYMAQKVPLLSGNKSVKIVPKKVSAIDAAMTVEYSEIGRLLPISHVLWFWEIEYNCYPIFIVLPDWPLVSRGRVGAYRAVPILWMLGRVKVRNRDKHLRQLGVIVLARPDAPLFESESFWMDKDFFPEYLV